MSLEIFGVPGLGEVTAGSDLAALIAGAVDLRDGDVLVVSSKICSKAAGRTAALQAGESADAGRRRIAEAEEVLADTPHVVIVRTEHGFVCANAGIDASNVPGGELLLLPADPDGDAAALRERVGVLAGVDVGVVVSDTFGRAWRVGQTDVALGVAGLAAVRDERGQTDRDGRRLSVTLIALADQLAGAADLVRDKASGVPVVVIRGVDRGSEQDWGVGSDLVRVPGEDLFPHGRGWLARRLATGAGAPVRLGPPTEQEWALVLAATSAPPAAAVAPGAPPAGGVLRLGDGLSAARAEAALLDLGYGVTLTQESEGWTVTVG